MDVTPCFAAIARIWCRCCRSRSKVVISIPFYVPHSFLRILPAQSHLRDRKVGWLWLRLLYPKRGIPPTLEAVGGVPMHGVLLVSDSICRSGSCAASVSWRPAGLSTWGSSEKPG